MLTNLTITNFAIIDHLEIEFTNDLIVLTGETGAGKSIIADALDFLLGSRSSPDLIKSNSNKAIVEGMFTSSLLPGIKNWFLENGFELENENQVLISRELSSQGSKVRINGHLASVSHLNFLRNFLLELHEQNQHIELLNTEKQLEILDGFGGKDHKELLETYKKEFYLYVDLKDKLNKKNENKEEVLKKIEFLNFQIKEITEANITDINEEEILLSKKNILLNKKEISENTNLLLEMISEDEAGILNNLSKAKKINLKLSSLDNVFNDYTEKLENIVEEIRDFSSFLNHYKETLEDSSEDLNEIEEKLDLFYKLKRKYGGSLVSILNSLELFKNELKELQGSNLSEKELEKQFLEKEKVINELGNKLTEKRKFLALDLSRRINNELINLGFNKGADLLKIKLNEKEISEIGKEEVLFLFSSNPGEELKPIVKVASGGELSRIMLAIKSILSNLNIGKTFIFDEVDIGISGEIALNVARKLYKISKNNQVFCITHQPIIAAMADVHFVVEKKVKDGKTFIEIQKIENTFKEDALARLLTPDKNYKEINEDAKQFAKSLLENAQKVKLDISCH